MAVLGQLFDNGLQEQEAGLQEKYYTRYASGSCLCH